MYVIKTQCTYNASFTEATSMESVFRFTCICASHNTAAAAMAIWERERERLALLVTICLELFNKNLSHPLNYAVYGRIINFLYYLWTEYQLMRFFCASWMRIPNMSMSIEYQPSDFLCTRLSGTFDRINCSLYTSKLIVQQIKLLDYIYIYWLSTDGSFSVQILIRTEIGTGDDCNME